MATSIMGWVLLHILLSTISELTQNDSRHPIVLFLGPCHWHESAIAWSHLPKKGVEMQEMDMDMINKVQGT